MAILARTNPRKNREGKIGRFLITVTVLGSAGPIRCVVKEGERVSDVIASVLKSYAREGRRPILGLDNNDFLLYSSSTYGSEVLSHVDTLFASGGRNFVLWKKQKVAIPSTEIEMQKPQEEHLGAIENKGGKAVWKSWFYGLKVSSR